MAGDIMRKIIIAVLLIACLVLLAGCTQTNEENIQTSDEMDTIDDNATEETADNETADNDSIETTDEIIDENRTAEDNQALIAQLMEEQGLVDEDGNETDEEEDTDGNWTIEIIHMRGEPEKDFTIDLGDSVTFISRQPNYIHRIQLREKLENGAFDSTLLDPAVSLKNNESFTYIFEKAGKFQWYSKTNYPTTSGYITVE